MRPWFRGKRGGFIAFLLISALVVGGLGWATGAALRLEQEQLDARRQGELSSNLRLALWRLDSLVAPALMKEDSRPYNHYSAIFAPPAALYTTGNAAQPGTILEPSPLLGAELPEWMLLHFQVDVDSGWRSPQVLSQDLAAQLHKAKIDVPLTNVTPGRADLLARMSGQVRVDTLVALVAKQETRPPLQDVTLLSGSNSLNNTYQPMGQVTLEQQSGQALDKEYNLRLNRAADMQQRQQKRSENNDSAVALGNFRNNGEDWLSPSKGKPRHGEQVVVTLGPMVPLWFTVPGQPDRLLYVRHVQVGKRELCQGIVLDWSLLEKLLAEEAKKEDLFPGATIEPVREGSPAPSERAMTVLPLQLNPGALPVDNSGPGWTPLRIGLILAWAAALLALGAVGLGGWSLLNLSERRIRFVSAVTHELRTPLTTLRLYLDMLAGGMVKDSKQKEEYLQTLNLEADRLNRLVGNVLDFSRLENQRPRLVRTPVVVSDLLEQVRSLWQARCLSAEKELVVENAAADLSFITDVHMVQQILGNLIDNACKYSHGAADPHIWLRARQDGRRRLILEVEDRGPGVPIAERRSIFRAFRRGTSTETTGGVGLGLALATRWARLLGGKLRLCSGSSQSGACFQLVLPVAPLT